MQTQGGRRTWLVVGAGRNGIGTAIAADAAAGGDEVIMTGLEVEAASVPEGKVGYHQLDVCDSRALEEFAKRVDHVDVLVNCAGIARRDEEEDIEVFRKVVDVNLIGNFAVIKQFEDKLIRARGVIINIASVYSFCGSPKVPAYGASKAAIHQLTRSMAVKLSPLGVRVNAIAPGFIVTEMTAKARADKEHYDNVMTRTLFGRWGDPSDISGVAMFLASDQAKFVTGHTVVADGGFTIV